MNERWESSPSGGVYLPDTSDVAQVWRFACDESEHARRLRLITAAPDLLAIAKEYSLPITGDYKRDCFEFGDIAVDRELRRRAAIAKATETPNANR